MKQRSFAEFAHSPRILGAFVSDYRCGWFDGGCFVFARALQLWLGGCLAVIVRKELYERRLFDHCVLSVNHQTAYGEACYLDANGLSTKTALLQYWRLRERLPDPVLEDPMDLLRLDSHLDLEAWSAWLAQQLQGEFGTPNAANLREALGTARCP